MKYFRQSRVWMAAVLVAVVVFGLPVLAQEKESFRAFAVNMGSRGPVSGGQSTVLQITVDRWSTNDERNELFAALAENGQDGLVKALQDQEEVGFVRLTDQSTRAARRSNFPSTRFRYARQINADGKRRIVLVTDRPIPYWEAMGRPRTYDYNVSFIVMDLDEEGKGEGQMAIGVQLSLNMEDKVLEIENFATEPVRLTNISTTS